MSAAGKQWRELRRPHGRRDGARPRRAHDQPIELLGWL
jgi:hypothetical protein